MKLDETRIQYYLSRRLLQRGHYITIPNVSWSWLLWEADLISITKSNYMYEYEIKISRSDFEKDFRKGKHLTIKTTPWRGNTSIPNYFLYVAPLNAIPLCIPSYAGLIEVVPSKRYQHGMYFTEIKKPKKIHGKKQDATGIVKMLRTIMFKYWDLASILETIKIQKQLFQ